MTSNQVKALNLRGQQTLLDVEQEVALLNEFRKARNAARRSARSARYCRKATRTMIVEFKVDGKCEEVSVQHLIPGEFVASSDFRR